VEQALREWAAEESARHPELVRLGYFGSYARGDWGVGSDLDVVAVVKHSELPFHARGAQWAVERLPVSTDLLVYTEREWDELRQGGSRFATTLANETVWVAP
jgi:predicted nucleotidyltransferase